MRRIMMAVVLLFAALAGANYFADLHLLGGYDEAVGVIAAALLLVVAFYVGPTTEEERRGIRAGDGSAGRYRF
jgi:hypothetical protein